jgi:septal ring factor EnvC (AmiA/AmiB activator)
MSPELDPLATLATAIADYRKRADDREQEIATLRREVTVLTAKCATLDDNLKDVKEENKLLVGQLKTAEDALSKERKISVEQAAALHAAEEKHRAERSETREALAKAIEGATERQRRLSSATAPASALVVPK